MQIEDLKKEIEKITDVEVSIIKVETDKQLIMLHKLIEMNFLDKKIYIAKRSKVLEYFDNTCANKREFHVFNKDNHLSFTYLDKCMAAAIKNFNIIQECGICYGTEVKLLGCTTCINLICEVCVYEILKNQKKDTSRLCPFCKTKIETPESESESDEDEEDKNIERFLRDWATS
jgi:hypothetical protein